MPAATLRARVRWRSCSPRKCANPSRLCVWSFSADTGIRRITRWRSSIAMQRSARSMKARPTCSCRRSQRRSSGLNGVVMKPRHFITSMMLVFAFLPLGLRAQITQAEFASRRAALAAALGDGVLVAFGSPEPEEDYISFYQNSQFRYLTGFTEPDAALVLDIKAGKLVGEHLFVVPSNPSEEMWTGKRL